MLEKVLNRYFKTYFTVIKVCHHELKIWRFDEGALNEE